MDLTDKQPDKVKTGFSAALPAPPGMQVRTRQFPETTEPQPGNAFSPPDPWQTKDRIPQAIH